MQDKKKPGESPAPSIPPIKKTTVTTTEELIPEDAGAVLEETDDIRNPARFHSLLSNWLASVNSGDHSFTATLYKYGEHKQKQECVDEQQDRILTLQEIGLGYGSGCYRYLITFPDGEGLPAKAVLVNLHKCWDEKRERLGIDKAPEPVNGKSGLMESMEILTKFAEIFKTMIPQAPAPSPGIAEMMRSNYELMNGFMRKSFQDQSDLYKRLMLEKIEDQDEDKNKEGEPESNMKDIIMPLIDKFIPILLGEGPKAQLTAETIKALPEFQKLLKEKAQLSGIVQAITKEIGATKTAKILKRLGVPA